MRVPWLPASQCHPLPKYQEWVSDPNVTQNQLKTKRLSISLFSSLSPQFMFCRNRLSFTRFQNFIDSIYFDLEIFFLEFNDSLYRVEINLLNWDYHPKGPFVKSETNRTGFHDNETKGPMHLGNVEDYRRSKLCKRNQQKIMVQNASSCVKGCLYFLVSKWEFRWSGEVDIWRGIDGVMHAELHTKSQTHAKQTTCLSHVMRTANSREHNLESWFTGRKLESLLSIHCCFT